MREKRCKRWKTSKKIWRIKNQATGSTYDPRSHYYNFELE